MADYNTSPPTGKRHEMLISLHQPQVVTLKRELIRPLLDLADGMVRAAVARLAPGRPPEFDYGTIIEVARELILIGVDDYLDRPSLARQMFCLKCRKPQAPAGRMADFVANSATSGALIGISARTEDTSPM
jgi:hypothetical protein